MKPARDVSNHPYKGAELGMDRSGVPYVFVVAIIPPGEELSAGTHILYGFTPPVPRPGELFAVGSVGNPTHFRAKATIDASVYPNPFAFPLVVVERFITQSESGAIQ